MNLTDSIKLYLRLGLSVIPIRPGEKKPAIASWEEFTICRPDSAQWNAWWKEFQGKLGVAVVYSGSETPLGSQLVCVDVDSNEAEEWVELQSGLPVTPTVWTPRGYHRYFLAPAGLGHFKGSEMRPEVRAGEHYSILPPSLHPSGKAYQWDPELTIGDVEFAELPAWGISLMRGGEANTGQVRAQVVEPRTPEERQRSYGKSALGREIAELAAMTEGGRNDQLNRAAFSLGQLIGGGALDEVEVRQGLIGACHANGLVKADGLRQVERTMDSGLSNGKAEPRMAPQQAQKVKPQPAQVSCGEPPSAEATNQPDAETEQAMVEAVGESVNMLPLGHDTKVPMAVPPGSLLEIAGNLIDKFEDYRLRPRVVTGLRTGFRAVDNHFLGFAQFPLIVVQGQSGYGKTLFAKHCIFATALAEAQAVTPAETVVFLLEDTLQQLVSSFLGYRWGLPRQVREPGSQAHLTREMADRMARGYAEFWQLPITGWDDTKDIREIERRICNLAEKQPLAGVVIDHAHEVEVPRGRNRSEEVSQVAQRFRDLGEKLQVPIMLLSQTTMTKEGNFETQWSGDLRKKSYLCWAVDRGVPGSKREDAVQSNVMRLVNDKARGWPVMAQTTLKGDWNTGRLWEADEYDQMQSHQAQRETTNEWPGNE